MDLFSEFSALEKLLAASADFGMKLLQVIGTLLLCWILIRISNNAAKKFFHRQTKKQRLAMTERKAYTLSSITSSVVKYVIYFIGVFSILKQLGVSGSALVVVASAGSVAVGLGAQSIVTDMLEGFFILFEDHYAVGDLVTIQNITGVVESVTLRSTKIRDPQGRVHIIPNGNVGTVTNLCSDFINATVTISVAYNEKIDHVLLILADEMSRTTDMEALIEPPVVAGITDLGESAITVKVIAKCQIKTNVAVESELRRRIKNRFDLEGIEIPYPQRTIHVVQKKEE